MKKHTIFWGKANTVTGGISYTFSSLFSKHHIRGKKGVCRGGEDPLHTAHQMHSVFSDPYYCFLTLSCKYCMEPSKQCLKHEALNRGSCTKRKRNKALPWDKYSPPTKHFKVKSSQPAVKIFTPDSGQVIKFVLLEQADVKGQRTHRIFI